jgi:hypothetical protein
MNEFVIIFLGIFILIIFIILFVLLYYLYDNYSTYNEEVKDNLYKSEQVINDTSRAFNRLQDNVINKIAKVNSNQEVIINNNSNASGRISANLLNIMDVSNNGISFSNLTSNIIDPSKSVQIKLKPEITTYSNISVLTGSNYVNICDNAVNSSNRKCLNINVDGTGTFNINTSNNVSASNIANISIRDTSNKVMAVFDGANKKISLGSNIAPAIEIIDNVYTTNIIVCNYIFIDIPEVEEVQAVEAAHGRSAVTAVKGRPAVHKIIMTLISNFDIKPLSYLNFIIYNNIISSVDSLSQGYINPTYTFPTLKLQNVTTIPKNTITTFDIMVTYNMNALNFILGSPNNTNAYITPS